MKVLNLHGYGSQPENGMYHALVRYGVSEFMLPMIDYSREAPAEIFNRLLLLCQQDNPDVLTGCSMGGFFAALLSSVTGKRAVLVNPCVTPHIILPRLGTRDRAFARQYLQLGAHLTGLRNAYALLGGKDDLLDTHDFVQFLLPEGHSIVLPEGGHPSSTMPLDEVFAAYGKELFGV